MRLPIVLVVLAAGASAIALSCTTTNDGNGAGVDAGSDLDATAGGGGSDTADEPDAAPTQAFLRVAHFSPGTPALDVCLAAHGTGLYAGPLLALFADDAGLATDASAPGLSYAQVGAYIAVDPGTYDVRLVSAGASSCSSALPVAPIPSEDAGMSADASADAGASESTDAGADANAAADADAGESPDADASASTGTIVVPDATNLATFKAGDSATLLVLGEPFPTGTDASFRIAVVRDDPVLAGGAASVRLVNALPGVPAVDFGFGSFAGGWSPLFTKVAFGSASTQAAPNQGAADPNGYVPVAPFGPQLMSVRASTGATGDVLQASMASVQAGAVVTFVAFGGASGDPDHPPSLLACTDNQASGGLFADCSVAR
jgi:hypothetical protein